jgi:formylglycine-generating enzyme required for sulfatase activity
LLMKKPKGKQTPIFSKLQDILQEQSSATLSGEPLKRAETRTCYQSEPEEMPLPHPKVLSSRELSSPISNDRNLDKDKIPDVSSLEKRSLPSLSNESFSPASTASPNQSEHMEIPLTSQKVTHPSEHLSQLKDQDLGEIEVLDATPVEAEFPKIVLPKPEIEVMVNSLGMAFVKIQAGTFVMGSSDYEAGRNEDELPHEVSISKSFYIQTTPVTQGQWQALMGQSPAGLVQAGEYLPVGGINWQDCQLFIKKLNGLGEGDYRLPTEAEWEYACRAGSDMALANGELLSLYCEADPNLEKIGWYCSNSDRKLHPVGKKDSNGWGLYDMHGNIGEWCQDWYGPYPEIPQTDPIGPSSGPGRVIRGGSWFSSAKNCRSAARFYWSPQSRDQLNLIGLRLVRKS